MTKDEALRMAIEALIHHTEQTRPIEDTNKAIQACKEALEQPTTEQSSLVQEPKPPTMLAKLPNGTTASNVYDAYEAGLKEGKAETQEPVAYVCIDSDAKETSNIISVELPCHTELYTTPPSREWQSLSDDEVQKVLKEMWDKGAIPSYSIVKFASAIEAKLREKNELSGNSR